MSETTRRRFMTNAALWGVSALALPSAWARKPQLPFPELKAQGSPGTLGLAHGRTFSQAIKRNVGIYVSWLTRVTRTSEKHLLQVAGTFKPVLSDQCPHLLEEMEAIAKGAGRAPQEILLLNARTDLLVLGRAQAPAAQSPGCTALALQGRAGGKPALAVGQNWDWLPSLAQGTVVLRLSPQGKPPLVTFTEAGMVGKIGCNAQHLGVCLNFLGHKTEDPEAAPGIPIHCLLRLVMESESLEEAYKMVAWAPRCASGNFLVGQHQKGRLDAFSLELTPSAVARLPLDDGTLVHTNHFKDPALAPGCDSGRGFSTINRDKTATELANHLRQRMPNPVDRMKHVLACRKGAPSSVSKTSSEGSKSMTLAGIVMDLTHNRLYLTQGPTHQGHWVRRPGA